MVQPQEPLDPNEPPEEYPFWTLVRRSLARRFPRVRIAFNWTKARIWHIGAAIRNRTVRFFTTFGWAGGVAGQIYRLRREPGLTVGVDVASLWEPLTGVGWYLYRLLEETADAEGIRIRLFPPTVVASDDLPEPVVPLPTGRAIDLMQIDVPPERVVCAGATIRLLRRIEPVLRSAMGSSVLFAPNFYLPRSFLLSRSPTVATVHDLGSVQVPWTLSDETLEALSTRLETSLAKASSLITVSDAVRNELIAHGYEHPERIHAIHHGPGHLSTVEPGSLPPGVPSEFALHVGTLEPRKNVATLLEAWEILSEGAEPPPTLVLSGHYGWKSDEIQSLIGRAQSQGRVIHLGYVPDDQLAALYKRASVVVVPSLYEGFGLPAVEAQFAGAPLVCSDIPVLHEVAGDGALFAPTDRADLFAAAVRSILSDADTRAELVEKGKAQVAKFSWSKTADDTIRVWRQVGSAS